MDELLAAARLVIASWESGDLACAVRELDRVVRNLEPNPTSASHLVAFLNTNEGCPICGPDGDIEGGAVGIDGVWALQDVSCSECGALWTNCHKLHHINFLRQEDIS